MTNTLVLVTSFWPILFCGQSLNQPSSDTLIQKLGSPRFTEREAATKALLDRYPEANSSLQKAANSQNPEIAVRAKNILQAFATRSLEERLVRLQRFIKWRSA